jgi:hypothetical protein
MTFSITIPNVLSTALIRYKEETGSAGAFLGLIYYLMIGTGLIIIGYIQNLGISCLIFSGIGALALLLFQQKEKNV